VDVSYQGRPQLDGLKQRSIELLRTITSYPCRRRAGHPADCLVRAPSPILNKEGAHNLECQNRKIRTEDRHHPRPFHKHRRLYFACYLQVKVLLMKTPVSRNKRTPAARELLEQNSHLLMQKGLCMALEGDGPLLRTLLGYVLDKPKETSVKIGPLAMKTIDDLALSSETVLQKLGAGQITPAQAREIFDMIEIRRRVLESQEIANRESALEQAKEAAEKEKAFALDHRLM
jgi:hypothetical protein